MDEPIQIRYEVTAEELLAASSAYIHVPGRQKDKTFLLIVIPLVLVVVILVGTNDFFRFALIMLACVAYLFGVLLVVQMRNQRRFTNRFKQLYGEKCKVEWLVTSDALKCEDSAGNAFTYRWQAPECIIRTTKGFMIGLDSARCHWIPLKGFDTPMNLERFVELARTKSVSYIETA